MRTKEQNKLFMSRSQSDSVALQIFRLTAVGDVEASAGHGVVSLELQLQDVGVAGEVGRDLGTGEAAQHLAVAHRQEVVGRLQVEVVESQLNSASLPGDDQPHAVQIVTVAFWVIRGQDSP